MKRFRLSLFVLGLAMSVLAAPAAFGGRGQKGSSLAPIAPGNHAQACDWYGIYCDGLDGGLTDVCCGSFNGCLVTCGDTCGGPCST